MSMLLRCPMNHQWEVIPSDLFTATLYPLICPKCGLDTTDPQGLLTAPLAIDPLASRNSAIHLDTGLRQELAVFPGYEVLSVLGRGAMSIRRFSGREKPRSLVLSLSVVRKVCGKEVW